MARHKTCSFCKCRNGKHRANCGKCGWDLSRPWSLELELTLMEEKDPALKAKAAKVAQAAKNLGLVKEDA